MLSIDRNFPLDISIALRDGLGNVNAFYAPPLLIEPVRSGDFVGDILLGGVVNFKNVRLNPHGNGTHTECVGHISRDSYTLNQCLRCFWFRATLISVYPQRMENGDRIIVAEQISELLAGRHPEALVIRTLPNGDYKQTMNYSGSNPPYLHYEVTRLIADLGIEHLLIDLPSVDREEDGGELLAHHHFWQYPHAIRVGATISELIYVPNAIKDGDYWLNLMITALELDASPSKPILYSILN